jgi:hypothetical protein
MRTRRNSVLLRLDDSELAHLDKLVSQSGLSREQYLRTLLSGFIPINKPPPDYHLMMRELHSIGNNLNQIAQRAHATGDIDAVRYERNATALFEITTEIIKAVYEHRRLESWQLPPSGM